MFINVLRSTLMPVALLAVLLCSGCGQTGALYLPAPAETSADVAARDAAIETALEPNDDDDRRSRPASTQQ